MTNETVEQAPDEQAEAASAQATPIASAPSASKEREQSTIAFPYNDLDDAVEVARAIHDNFGLECTNDQLAGAMNQTVTSGAFRLKVAAARTFGLVHSTRGNLALTDNGRAILDETQERSARARAFLFVPLYNAIHEAYKGNILPPAAALEREMVKLGVAVKQADKARQAFERSAQSAGFFQHGRNRLVMPSNVASPAAAPAEKPGDAEQLGDREDRSKNNNGGGGGGHSDLHPFIEGLLRTLPEPESEWQAEDRVKWLQTAANIFDLIYKGSGGIRVETATAVRSPRPE